MDLTTTYLGLELDHPLMPGASPLVDDLGTVKRLEDAGAAAIVMHSLFEEQIAAEAHGRLAHIEAHQHSYGEALSYFPEPDDYHLGPDRYLEQVRAIKDAVKVPVIGIGAGPACDGQILVTHDMLGLYTRFRPRFVRRYAELAQSMSEAFERYAQDVRTGDFPSDGESY